MEVFGFSYAKKVFTEGSREGARMVGYATLLDAYTLVVFTTVRDGFTEKVTRGNFTAYPTNSKSKAHILFDAYRLGKQVLKDRKLGDTIITAQDPFESGVLSYLLSRMFRLPLHVQVHGSFFSSSLWRRESFLNRIRYVIGLWILGRAKCIRVVSERIKQSLIHRGINERRIVVLPIRTEVDRFLRIQRSREDQGEGNSAVTILTVGRLAPEKNLELIIRAVKGLVTEAPFIRLRIVGSGPEEHHLKTLVKTLDLEHIVTFVPWVEDVSTEMQGADIYALSSNHEGYALVLIEAMASGLPLVTTDVGCVGEVVRDGVHGNVVPTQDLVAFENALRALVKSVSLRTQYGMAGRSTAKGLSQITEDEYRRAWVAALFCDCEAV